MSRSPHRPGRVVDAAPARRTRRAILLTALPIAAAFYIGIVLGVIAAGIAAGVSALVLGLPLAIVAGLLVGRISTQSAAAIREESGLGEVREAILPLRFRLDPDQPERIEILHPELDPEGSPADVAVINLARRLTLRGARPRLVILDNADLPGDWRESLARRPDVGPFARELEVAVAGSGGELAVSPADRVLATGWRAAHAADTLCVELPVTRFTYLIREYEPFRYPMGSFAALADESYELPHRAIFLDRLLGEYFADQRLGVFAAGPRLGLREAVSLDEPILPVRPRTVAELAAADRRRLLISAHPDGDETGSMYELAVMALDRAVLAGHFRGWDLAATGTGGEATGIVLSRSSARLRILPELTASEMASLLPGFDVGVALRYAPGLGPVPAQMAAAGISVVTTTFTVKDPAALAGISPNLIAAEPRIEAITTALAAAGQRTGDHAGRIEGARVDRPDSWDAALDDETMTAIEDLLNLA